MEDAWCDDWGSMNDNFHQGADSHQKANAGHAKNMNWHSIWFIFKI